MIASGKPPVTVSLDKTFKRRLAAIWGGQPAQRQWTGLHWSWAIGPGLCKGATSSSPHRDAHGPRVVDRAFKLPSGLPGAACQGPTGHVGQAGWKPGLPQLQAQLQGP